jgi:hypothetical protein
MVYARSPAHAASLLAGGARGVDAVERQCWPRLIRLDADGRAGLARAARSGVTDEERDRFGEETA